MAHSSTTPEAESGSQSRNPREVRSPQGLVAEIASLSTTRIAEMGRGELAEIIRAVRGNHLRPGVLEELPVMNVPTLQRLVLATRRFCQGQSLLDAWGDQTPPCGRSGIPR